jgi:hypothetical protein
MSPNSAPEAAAVERPFSEWPQTAAHDDGTYHITGKYYEPSGWWTKVFPRIMVVGWLIVAPWSCAAVQSGPDDNAGMIAFGTWTAIFLTVAILGEQFGPRRDLNIRMGPDAIQIEGRRFPRDAPYNFAMEEHEKAYADELQRRRGYEANTYREAVQVVMRYGERRIPIAGFRRKDIRKAEALLIRLQLLDKAFERGPAPNVQVTGGTGDRDEFGPAKPVR